MLGIIGGSGFEKFEGFENLGPVDRETPFGLASSGMKKVRIEGVEALFISRHGEHHELLPSEINYRANIYALKKLGAKAIVSFSAVGSLQKELAPGDLVIPHQYIDRTKGIRGHTFLGQGLIGHVSLAKPVCNVMADNAKKLCADFKFKSHFGQTYICIEGPYFSSGAESHSYRQMGAHIIGMSNFPEYALAREAGLPYLPCCWVTDYDCWDDSIPHVTVDEVIRIMKGNNEKAFTLLKSLIKHSSLWNGSTAPDGGLRSGLFMPLEAVPADKKHWLEILMAK
jgi:5'-methylthioadenosine phosphorylase